MNSLNHDCGKIYIVATPIGNLDDMTIRAINILKNVDLILAEDTRHANVLLQHYQIQTPRESFHAHNEQKKTERYLNMLQKGTQLALVSDAGTPLICDPGFPLILQAKQQHIEIIPIPGPCALICALSAAGVPTDQFSFHGFPPAKSSARQKYFEKITEFHHTIAFYESTHRILDSLNDLQSILGEQQYIVLAKELTKSYEHIQTNHIKKIIEWLQHDPKRIKGEFVVIIPAREEKISSDEEAKQLLKILVEHVGAKQAAQIGHEFLDLPKNHLYQLALKLQKKE